MLEKTKSGLLVPVGRLKIGGTFSGKLIRAGKVIEEWEDKNLIVNQGLDHILSTEFAAGGQITQWYIGLFSNNYVPTPTDTAASIVANAGEVTAYTGNRPGYQGVEGSQQVTNQAAPATFTFTSPINVFGAFLISSQGQQSTSGTLFSASQFTAAKAAQTGDQLLITYAIGAAST